MEDHVKSIVRSSGNVARLYILKSETHTRKDGNPYVLVRAYSRAHAYYIAQEFELYDRLISAEGEHKTTKDIINFITRCSQFNDGHSAGPEPVDYILSQ
jgi:hypothetical protein